MNSNVNIADRMFAYIKHGVDLTEDIKNSVFSNSLIVIGDEERLYIPAKNAYVGIGQTAYTNTIERIKELELSVADLNNHSFGGVVSKLYAGFTPDEYHNITGEVDDSKVYLNNELTIKALGNYDPSTGKARTSYVYYERSGNSTVQKSTTNSSLFDPNQKYATSGINITTYYGQTRKVWNEATQQFVQKQVGNYIVIDDKQTWSYMTSSYAYALNYIRDYTNSEIDRLYHNIMGDAGDVYVPVSFGSVYKIVNEPEDASTIYNASTNPTGTVIARGTSPDIVYYEPDYSATGNNTNYYIKNVNTGVYTQVSIADLMSMLNGSPNGTQMYDNDEAGKPAINIPQLYILDTQYNNTYNMNLRDGINTLKEVAYVLDILTDGNLGKTTYITYSTYEANKNDITVTYNLIQPVNDHPKSDDLYAYYVSIDTENIGIKMAYSIAGNKAEIDANRKDIVEIQSGEGTVRSIQSTDTELVNVVLTGGTTLTNPVGTDPNTNVNGAVNPNSYTTGDINIHLDIDYGTTYATVNTNKIGNDHITTVNGITFYDQYRAADMSKIHVDSVDGNNYTVPAYFVLNGSNMVQLTSNQVVEDPHQRTSNTQYYWLPTGSAANSSQNPVYEYISKKELSNSSESDSKFNNTSNILYTYKPSLNQYTLAVSGATFVTEGINWYNGDLESGSDGRLYYLKDWNAIEVHAQVPASNKLSTTEWTIAYVKDKLALLEKNISANGSGNSDVDLAEVKTDLRYSDFESLYWNFVKSNYVEGSAAYKTAYDSAYQDFIDGNTLYDIDGTTVILSSANYGNTLRHKLESGRFTYIYQENGIIKPGPVTELPTDTVETEINIWGDETSDNAFGYSAIEALTTDDSLLQTIFKWQNSSATEGPNNQIFVIDGWTYYKVAPGTLDNSKSYFMRNASGDYVSWDQANHPISNYSDKNHKSWIQLYIKGPKYVELDLTSAQITTNTVTVTGANELKFNNKYIVVKDGSGNLTVSGNEYSLGNSALAAPGTGITKLYYISSNTSEQVKYLSVENRHYNYTKGGNGENKFVIKANITKLENATPSNTGFADAYDVKTYIDNLFKWVDISASVDSSTLLLRDAFYKAITYSEYDAISGAKPTLYYKLHNDVSDRDEWTEIQTSSVNVDWFYYDGNSLYTGSNTSGPTAADSQSVGKSTVNGIYGREEFNATGASTFTSVCNYYIKLEDVKINPNNLNITAFGA